MGETESHYTDVMKTGVDIVDLFPVRTNSNQYVIDCLKSLALYAKNCKANKGRNCDVARTALEDALDNVIQYIMLNEGSESPALAEAKAFKEHCAKSVMRCHECAVIARLQKAKAKEVN